MRRSILPFLALVLMLNSCGYNMGSEGPVSLKLANRDLYIERVDNPTAFTWMEPRLRSLFRDEITRRGWSRLVDRKQATGLVVITVDRYTRNTGVHGRHNKTLRYTAKLSMSVQIISPIDNSVLWDSGLVTWSENYSYGEERSVDELVTNLAMRQIIDRMTQGY